MLMHWSVRHQLFKCSNDRTEYLYSALCLQVLEWSGSVLDVLSLAVRAALHNTRIPQLIVTGEGEEVEVEVSDNPHDSTPVQIDHTPIIITLTQVTR